MKPILQKIKSYISVLANLPFLYSRNSYSQEGEDLILLKLFDQKTNGFFVDVGAHHPFRYSNTYLLFKRSWKGINIDLDQTSTKLFIISRPDDINLNYGISSNGKILKYHIFEDGALNTLSEHQAEIVNKSGQSRFVGTKYIKTISLAKLLDKYLPKGQKIDLLNIDAEGMDFDVLKSNDWKRFKANIISIETLGRDESKIYKFLEKRGYGVVAQTLNTSIFKIVK